MITTITMHTYKGSKVSKLSLVKCTNLMKKSSPELCSDKFSFFICSFQHSSIFKGSSYQVGDNIINLTIWHVFVGAVSIFACDGENYLVPFSLSPSLPPSIVDIFFNKTPLLISSSHSIIITNRSSIILSHVYLYDA